MLISNASDDREWPSEVLQLREIFVKQAKEQHAVEVSKLKEQHERALNRAVEREKRNSLKADDSEIRKERDNLKKISGSLRHLVAELMKYFSRCEDELNNTLVDELLKHLNKITNLDESQLDSDNLDQSTCSSSSHKIKRVHFTPDVSAIIPLIDGTGAEDAQLTEDISTGFRTELELCLERLRSEANAILSLTTHMKSGKSSDASLLEDRSSEERASSLARQLITEKQAKNDLDAQLHEAKAYTDVLEKEKASLESQLELSISKQKVLVHELDAAKERISDLIESGRKEIVSEGYGENPIAGSSALGASVTSLAELHERARSLMLADESSERRAALYQLLEELFRAAARIVEESRRDRDDLVLQIEAADKKLRATTRFLEEQAVDRENERDDSQREIGRLKEQLKEAEANKELCDRINNEVERLEMQMRDMSVLMSECETRKTEAEGELKEAIDKIWVLRDIIRDLETQIESRINTEDELRDLVQRLRASSEEQNRCNEELNYELESIRSGAGCDSNKYEQHIARLEAEVQRLRLGSELVGPDGALHQVRSQLSELERTLDRRTKELESLHAGTVAGGTNCSSPSEDMSIRDQVQQQQVPSEELPLEQLARLRDRLVKHSRAEDAAVKRIRDLEMQLFMCKQETNEAQGERDVLQEQIAEQQVLISSLELRLEEQRIRADAAQKQANSSLEHRIYELESENRSLLEKIRLLEKTLRQLEEAGEETKRRLEEQQHELNAAGDSEHRELWRLKEENVRLSDRVRLLESSASGGGGILPELLDTIIAEKNAELDRLRDKLESAELETFRESPEQMRRLARSPSSSVRSIEQLRMRDDAGDTTAAFVGSSTRVSEQPTDSPPFVVDDDLSHIFKARTDRPVQTDPPPAHDPRDETIRAYEQQLSVLTSYVADVEQLRRKLEFSEETLRDLTDAHREEIEQLRHSEKTLRIEQAEVKMKLQEAQHRLEELEKDSHLKEQMCVNLTKDKRQLHNEMQALQDRLATFAEAERLLADKNKQIYELERQLADAHRSRADADADADELNHVRQLIVEKDKIINQMALDSHSLHLSLEAIQSKIQESGNIIELKKRLRDEQNLSAALHDELREMKQRLAQLDRERENCARLRQMLEAEKRASNHVQLQDADIIETMRVRLEQALDHEAETERILAEERAARERLEKRSLDSQIKTDLGFELTCIKMDLFKARTDNEILRSEKQALENLQALLKSEVQQLQLATDAQRSEIDQLREAARDNERLRRDLEDARRREEAYLKAPVPEAFLNKMREITGLLRDNADDNKNMARVITALTDQRRALETRVQELEAFAPGPAPSPATAPATDRIFSQLMRSESYRKALVFQKRYLLTLLASYQNCSTSCQADLKFVWPTTSSRRRGASRFRSAASVVVAICRMRFIVRRWAGPNQTNRTRAVRSSERHLGPPCGTSPPSKDRSPGLGTMIRRSVDVAPLETPALVARYVDRLAVSAAATASSSE